MPADDFTDPAAVHTFSHLSASIVLSRKRASEGPLPAVDPLQSSSKMATPGIVGRRHYALAQEIRRTLAQYAQLKDIIAMLGLEQLSTQDRSVADRARRLERFITQPFFTTEQFSGIEGKLVSLDDALDGCERILGDEFRDYPESALYMIGKVDEAKAKAKTASGSPAKPDAKPKTQVAPAADAHPIARLVSVGQRRPLDCRAKSHRVQLGQIGRQIGLDIAQALAPSQLRKRHGAELLGARPRAHTGVAAMALHDASEAGPRDELHDLREQGLADVHEFPQRQSSPGKCAVLEDRSSSRHQTRSADRRRQCLRIDAARLV